MDDLFLNPPRTIVLATDLSARCDRAFDRAVALARRWDAELIALTVIEAEADAHRSETLPSWRRKATPAELAQRQLRADLAGVGIRAGTRVAHGEPASAILDAVAESGAGLIVTGLARDETLGRFSLGNTVDRLARRTAVPLLVVRKRVHGDYQRIVAASDFSDASRRALETAASWFDAAVLTLLHTYDPPYANLMERSTMREDFRAVAVEDCERFAATLAPQLRARLATRVEFGAPEDLLNDYAIDSDSDLAVLGSHGRSALYDIMIGSVARRVLEQSAIDVLLVPEPKAARSRAADA
ncbi:MAG TPA: universal stress protein [Dokdonella sp.]|uniref:universal stress protein n=1 Tax=Dokdonella sp. TaxID=2291710 RepID=UPI002BDDDE28|nr:universal stress protein [Dokdonella sp.]HUD40683.1 universal stress protein [Dokdonella sp.]